MRIEDLMKAVPEGDNPYNVVKRTQQKEGEGWMSRGGRRDRRTIPETKMLIKEFMSRQRKPCLLLDICDALDRKPSPHFRGIVSEMVRDGELVMQQDTPPNSQLPRYWYSLS